MRDGEHYSVLFVRTEKQSEVCRILSEAFPMEHGRIFLPMLEYYRRDRREKDVKPLFPGYLFVCSDLDKAGLHRFLAVQGRKVSSFIKELGVPREGFGEDDIDTADLTAEESAFLERMLDADGVERMSAGYREGNGKIVVVEGPLRGMEERIVRVDRHERLAYLSFRFRELDVVAGLELRPRKVYVPDDETSAVLDDGTEIDIEELKKRMTEGSRFTAPGTESRA